MSGERRFKEGEHIPFLADASGICPCGKEVLINFGGQMIHPLPVCLDFLKDRPPAEYVRTMTGIKVPVNCLAAFDGLEKKNVSSN